MFKVTFTSNTNIESVANYLNNNGYDTKVTGKDSNKVTISASSIDTLFVTVAHIVRNFTNTAASRIKAN